MTYREATRKKRLPFSNHISPWSPRESLSLSLSLTSSLFFFSLSSRRVWYKSIYSEASREKVNILCIYRRHIFPVYFSVNTRYPPRDILYKIARPSTRLQFFIKAKRLQSYAVIDRRGNPDKNLSYPRLNSLNSAKREIHELYAVSSDIAPLKRGISRLLNYGSQSLRPSPPSWMRASSRSPVLPSPPYWIANNDFPHVAASPGIQCEKLQWLPALYFERFSARLTRRPLARREISADHTRRFSY